MIYFMMLITALPMNLNVEKQSTGKLLSSTRPSTSRVVVGPLSKQFKKSFTLIPSKAPYNLRARMASSLGHTAGQANTVYTPKEQELTGRISYDTLYRTREERKQVEAAFKEFENLD